MSENQPWLKPSCIEGKTSLPSATEAFGDMDYSRVNLIQINLGAQHPSTHGVLRIIAFVDSETIKFVEAELGLLHRGTEKLIETGS